MGGLSSKTVKTNYEVRHSVNLESATSNVKKGSFKKKNKSSVKIKEKKSVKKSKSVTSQDPTQGNLSVIEEVGDTAAEKVQSSCPVYRKKSSCPSCEARDILLGKNRSRSGSDKSLRFSDFNKVLRKTRIDQWDMEPLEIPLYGVEEPRPDDICYICEVYTGSLVRACRVCLRAYHDSCLSKIGHPLSESSRRLISADRWSCHQCASLNYLLTQEEIKNILNDLDDLDISKDNMTEANYWKYHKHILEQDAIFATGDRESNCAQRFRSVGQAENGAISYTQFLNLETVRVLGKRCKDSLVHLLTPAELAVARREFQKLDPGRSGLVKKSSIRAASPVLNAQRGAGSLGDSIVYMDEHPNSTVAWPEFLRDIAIYLIDQRSNPGDVEVPKGLHDNTEDGTLTFSSCDSLDVDEELYTTCNSELDASEEVKKLGASVSDNRHPDTRVSAGDRLTDARISTTDRLTDALMVADDSLAQQHNIRDGTRLHSDAAPDQHGLFRKTTGSLNARTSTDVPKTPDLHTHHPGGRTAQRSSKLSEVGFTRTSYQWADTDPKMSTERTQPSPYNDSHQAPIPWKDFDRRSTDKGENNDSSTPARRRSEVIRRQIVCSSGQVRAMSQVGCKNVQAPNCENSLSAFNVDQCKY